MQSRHLHTGSIRPHQTVGQEVQSTPAPGLCPYPYRLWSRGPGCIVAVRIEMEVIRCPLLLTLLTGGLGPTPGQREGEQAWVHITTTRSFIIQLTLRRGPRPGMVKEVLRAL